MFLYYYVVAASWKCVDSLTPALVHFLLDHFSQDIFLSFNYVSEIFVFCVGMGETVDLHETVGRVSAIAGLTVFMAVVTYFSGIV